MPLLVVCVCDVINMAHVSASNKWMVSDTRTTALRGCWEGTCKILCKNPHPTTILAHRRILQYCTSILQYCTSILACTKARRVMECKVYYSTFYERKYIVHTSTPSIHTVQPKYE
jgi:hypothetical protein